MGGWPQQPVDPASDSHRQRLMEAPTVYRQRPARKSRATPLLLLLELDPDADVGDEDAMVGRQGTCPQLWATPLTLLESEPVRQALSSSSH